MPNLVFDHGDINPEFPVFVVFHDEIPYYREEDTQRYNDSTSNDLEVVLRWAIRHFTRLGDTTDLSIRATQAFDQMTLARNNPNYLQIIGHNEIKTTSTTDIDIRATIALVRNRFPRFFPSELQETRMPSIAPTPTPVAPERRIVDVQVKREAGVLWLTIDATPLHAMLDALGVPMERGYFKDGPAVAYDVASSAGNQLSTRLFLRRTTEGTVKVRLSEVFPEPPSWTKLKQLADSAGPAVRKILEHYQPIDIQVSVQKKLVG